MHRHTLARAKEIERVARVHRDPFEPILPILEAASPVGEYRKITEEVLRRMPDGRRAFSTRSCGVRTQVGFAGRSMEAAISPRGKVFHIVDDPAAKLPINGACAVGAMLFERAAG